MRYNLNLNLTVFLRFGIIHIQKSFDREKFELKTETYVCRSELLYESDVTIKVPIFKVFKVHKYYSVTVSNIFELFILSI